ncbi:hypothetical protein NNO04_17610 [Citrobacter sp. Awk 4]|uniref:hypothetical protein n=1 Tax=Citrobacter sp. Awk 4 TaxID=2963955 RepID=UPI0023048903|nr:hypothetical protein [Citrobacter sp. Awk 4]MDA8480516.1 hypothetical protein [Citrobacter sp. Awk 4]
MKIMIRSSVRKMSIICVAIASLTGCDQPGVSQSKVAYIDIAKVLSESSIGKQEAQRNQDVRNVLVKADADAKEKYKEMSPKQQQQSSSADTLVLNQLWAAEQQHTRDLSVKAIADEAEKYRVNQKLDYVLNGATVVSADKKNDVTQAIIKQLEGKKVDYGDLPKISVSENVKETENPTEAPQDAGAESSVEH